MSRFESDWLDLREPADHAARAQALLDEVVRRFGARETVTVADLGAGGGSTLAALGPRLGRRQTWRLIDHDLALLRHAGARLSRLGRTELKPSGTMTRRDGAEIETVFDVVDLARDPLPRPAAEADLVTASALFDLVSEPWLGRFVERLANARRPLYAALTFDGEKRFGPPHPLDDVVAAAFNRHQRGDKGFGPALGAEAGPTLVRLARAAGFQVETAPSPWRFGPAQGALATRLVEGMAAAVAELADAPGDLDAWTAFRRAAATSGAATVGHVDILLTPRG